MKNLLLTTVMVGALLAGQETKAQIGFNLSVHVGNRPSWGVPGNVNANYYYMPEIDAYYDLYNRQFIYEDGGRWIFAANLPDYYRDYDLRTGYKVIVNEPRPYMRADFYRQQYGNRYNTYRRQDVYAQRNIRPEFRNDNRYDQRSYNDRFNQGHNDGRMNERFDNNRNGQRNNNDRGNQGRIENSRMENNRIENSRIDQRGNVNHGNQDRNDGQRPDTRRNEPVLTAPQQSGGYKDEYSDRKEGNIDQSRTVAPAQGQIRTAQRRGQ